VKNIKLEFKRKSLKIRESEIYYQDTYNFFQNFKTTYRHLVSKIDPITPLYFSYFFNMSSEDSESKIRIFLHPVRQGYSHNGFRRLYKEANK